MADKKRRRKKPVGVKGQVAIGFGGSPSGFLPIKYGDEKDEIEDYFFGAAVRNGGGSFYKLERSLEKEVGFLVPEHNPENDFDYTIVTDAGEKEDIDLMEVAILENRSYEAAPVMYSHGEFADSIWRKIADKSAGYGGEQERARALHLLLYTTDFRFSVNIGVLKLLSLAAHREKHAFTTIGYYGPDDQRSGSFVPVHPMPPSSFENFDEKFQRGRRSLFADLRMQVMPGGSVAQAQVIDEGHDAQRAFVGMIELEVPPAAEPIDT